MEMKYGVPRKALPRKQANVDTGHQIRPRVISPRAIFQWKNLIAQLKLLLKWMLIERWRRPSMLSSMRQHVTTLQFDSCAKKDSLCGTVMIHDGLNLRCLDQCHGVSSDGTSSSQSWRKRSVIRQSEFDPWVYTSLHPCFKPTWFMQVCLGKPSCEIRQR